jgi:hypothetical protein
LIIGLLSRNHALSGAGRSDDVLGGGCEKNVNEVWNSLHLDDANAPWFGITDSVGKLLAKSNTPDRPMLFPDAADTKRHFRAVLQKTAQELTPSEIDRLMGSLGE